MFKPKFSYTTFLEGLLIGGSLGTAMTFLLGTAEGKKLQKRLQQKYKDLSDDAKHYGNNLKKAIHSPAAKKLKRLAKKAVSATVSKTKTAKKTARKVKRKASR